MRAAWIPTAEFIEADVIRWKEPIFAKPNHRRNTKSVKLGERFVTAELLQRDQGWLCVLVRRCELLSSDAKLPHGLLLLREGSEIKRRSATALRGASERLVWSVKKMSANCFLSMPKLLAGVQMERCRQRVLLGIPPLQGR